MRTNAPTLQRRVEWESMSNKKPESDEIKYGSAIILYGVGSRAVSNEVDFNSSIPLTSWHASGMFKRTAMMDRVKTPYIILTVIDHCLSPQDRANPVCRLFARGPLFASKDAPISALLDEYEDFYKKGVTHNAKG